MKHKEPRPKAGQVVTVKLKGGDPDRINGQKYRLEDWWDRVTGGSWMNAVGNPAAIKYAMRNGFAGLPLDDEVVYGKVDGLGHLLHVSELEDVSA
jgi:hypothetical protein